MCFKISQQKFPTVYRKKNLKTLHIIDEKYDSKIFI